MKSKEWNKGQIALEKSGIGLKRRIGGKKIFMMAFSSEVWFNIFITSDITSATYFRILPVCVCKCVRRQLYLGIIALKLGLCGLFSSRMSGGTLSTVHSKINDSTKFNLNRTFTVKSWGLSTKRWESWRGVYRASAQSTESLAVVFMGPWRKVLRILLWWIVLLSSTQKTPSMSSSLKLSTHTLNTWFWFNENFAATLKDKGYDYHFTKQGSSSWSCPNVLWCSQALLTTSLQVDLHS